MSQELEAQLKKLAVREVPSGIHAAIIRRTILMKLQPALWTASVLLVLNLGISGWHIWSRITEVEGLLLLRSLLSQFEFSMEYLVDAGNTINTFFPVTTMLIFALNLVVAAYVIYTLYNIYHFKQYRSEVERT